MKKTVLLLCSTLVLLAGCSAEQATNTSTGTSGSDNKSASSPVATTEAASTPAETTAPDASELSLGDKGTVGDWKITVKKAAVKQKINASKYRYFKAKKGTSYVVVTLSARNNGKKEAQLLPRVGTVNDTITATLHYQDEYEYKPSQLIGYDKDLTTKSIQPLSTKSGIVVYEVPKKVAKDKKQLTLTIGTPSDSITYTLK